MNNFITILLFMWLLSHAGIEKIIHVDKGEPLVMIITFHIFYDI